MMTDYVYMVHFAQPISPAHTCQHYIGSAVDVDARFAEHLAGRGSRLCQVAIERNIDFWVVRIWKAEPGQGRQLERKLKARKMGPALCPICASERRRQQLQMGMPWADRLYDLLNFTLDDLPELNF